MAANPYTTTYLLASLRRRGMIPSTDEALATADFLAFADEELQTEVVQVLLAAREEYLVSKIPYDQTIVSGTTTYAIPPRAIGGKLRQVLTVDSNGDECPLTRVEPEHSGSDAGYMFEGNTIELTSTQITGTLRQTYFMRPNRLVATTAVGLISAINTGTGVITCNVPSTFTTSERFDFVKGTPGFECLAIDKTPSAVGGASITFSTSDLPSGLAVGDYVCLAGESPIPQIPVELHPFLSQRIVVRALEALGDPKAAVAEKTADRLRARAVSLIAPRDQGARRVIINRNGPGIRGRYLRRY